MAATHGVCDLLRGAVIALLRQVLGGVQLFSIKGNDPVETAVVESFTLVRGDVDANGRLDWADFQSLIDWLREDGPQPRCLAAGDLDGDGNVTIEDSVLALARLAAGTGLEVSMLYPRGAVDSLPCKELCP